MLIVVVLQNQMQNVMVYLTKNGNYTKDLGFLSASDQINKKLALRAGTDLNSNYESEMMKNRTGLRC